MDPLVQSIIIGVICLIAGIVAGKLLFAANTRKQVEEAESQSKRIIGDAQLTAETLKKEKLLEAKEKFVQMRAEHDKEVLERNKKIADAEGRIRSQEQSLNSKNGNLEKQIKENEAIKETLNRQIEVVNQKRTELKSTRKSIYAGWKKLPLLLLKKPATS
jgi:ribonuclease Y